MKSEIKNIDGSLLVAILNGGKVLFHKSRTNEKTNVSAHVIIVEMPKDVLFLNDDRYWKYLVFLHTPDMNGWWHASSNNLTKKKNESKMWDEWSEFKRHLKAED